MRFELKGNPRGGIRLIPEIPNQRLCRLEGLNGIGKTLAVRLLELATGQQPYAMLPAAWASLRENLGPIQIEVSGLQGGRRLSIELDPAGWGPTPRDAGVLGRAALDGSDIPFIDVSSVLSVVRIAGDETMAAQIRQRIESDSRTAEFFAGRAEARLRDLEAVSGRLLDTVRPFSRAELAHAEDASQIASRMRADSQAAVTNAANRVREIEELRNLERARARLADRAPRVESDIAQAEDSLNQLEARRVELVRRRDELRPAAEAAEVVLRQIQRLTHLRDRQAEDSRDVRGQVESLAQALDLPPETSAIAQALVSTQARIRELADRRKSFDVLPELDSLLRRVETALGESPTTLPETEVLAVVDGVDVSIAALRAGIDVRREQLSALQSFAALSEVDAELAVLSTRRRELGTLSSLLKEVVNLEMRLSRTESRLAEAFIRAKEHASEQYSSVLGELEDLEKERLAIVEKRATLRYTLGLLQSRGTADDLDRQIRATKRGLGVEQATELALADAAQALDRAKGQARTAEEEAAAATSARAQFARRLHEAIELIRSDAETTRLLSRSRLQMPGPDANDTDYLPVFERLTAALERLQNAVDKAAIQANGLTGNLTTLGPLVGTGAGDVAPGLVRLATHYAGIVGELLSRPEMRHALFDGGTFEAIDLLRGEVSWLTSTKELRRRPLEAFSSGESAFAYVLASAISRTQPAARNRLLVLDEFGAFIEAGKMRDLIGFLEKDVLNAGRADQVVVILPLRDADQARSLGTRGYMTVEEAA